MIQISFEMITSFYRHGFKSEIFFCFWQQISNDDDDEIDKKFAFVDMKICCFLFFNQKN